MNTDSVESQSDVRVAREDSSGGTQFVENQPIEVEWYNSATKKTEWRQAAFGWKTAATDRQWRATIKYDGALIPEIAPECIRAIAKAQ